MAGLSFLLKATMPTPRRAKLSQKVHFFEGDVCFVPSKTAVHAYVHTVPLRSRSRQARSVWRKWLGLKLGSFLPRSSQPSPSHSLALCSCASVDRTAVATSADCKAIGSWASAKCLLAQPWYRLMFQNAPV